MYDLIKAQMTRSVPFAATTGVEIVQVGDGVATAALEQRTEVSNHIGSLHAGAQFTVGETASGAAVTGAFAAHLATARLLATGASVSYLKVAKGRVEARARLERPAEDLRAVLESEGRVPFAVNVDLESGGEPIATMTVGWLVSRR